jgi:uncharacterized protein
MFEIIDAHAHLGPWPKFAVADKSTAATLALMDHLGVRTVIVAHHAGLVGLLEEAATLSEEAYAMSGGRILSYLVYNPNRAELSLSILRRHAGRPYLMGVKIHPSQHGCPADDERYRPAWELAQEHDLALISHTWGHSIDHPAQNNTFPDLFERYLAEFPDVRFVFGHGGGRYDGFLACARLMRAYPNTYMDITGDGFLRGRLDYFVGELGSERILYGSDSPWIDPRFVLGEVLGARITDEDRENILARNAVRLFGLEETGH